MSLDLTRCKLTPFRHQVIGIEKLVKDPIVALFDEMGSGKSFQVITAAQILFELGIIDKVLIIAPASVRTVWYDPDFGEIHKHLWEGFPAAIYEFHSSVRMWGVTEPKTKKLQFMISNYEFVRSSDRLDQLLPYCTEKTLLVLDESSAVKNYKAKQTIASLKLRRACGRVVILNGTPISNSPADLYSQCNILDPLILGYKTYFHFRSRHAILGGWMNKVIIKWVDIEVIQQKLAPYVLRRLKIDCIDLPDKLDSVVMTVPMSSPTWKVYQEMKNEMVAWLTETSVSSASQAIVKSIRLAQITSGFLGGVEEVLNEDGAIEYQPIAIKEVGREKLDFFLSWLNDQLDVDPNIKILIWCRFRAEVKRLFEELEVKYPKISLGKIWGGQSKEEREDALKLLNPLTMPSGPTLVIGTPSSGSMGLNLTGAHIVFYLSNDFSLKTRLQSEDRVHRPGQIHNVSYYDMIATGPNGQKTIDHTVVRALKNKQNLADFTTSQWLDVLREE